MHAFQWRILGGFWPRARRAHFGEVVKIGFYADFGLFGPQHVGNTPPDPYIQKIGFFRPLKCADRKFLKKTHFEDFDQNVDPIGHFGPRRSGHLRNFKMYHALLKILGYRFFRF